MDDNERANAILDALIEVAGRESGERIGRSYVEPEHTHVFSKRHEARMRRLFRKLRYEFLLRKVIKYTMIASPFILAFIILSGVTIFSVQAWRENFLYFLIDILK